MTPQTNGGKQMMNWTIDSRLTNLQKNLEKIADKKYSRRNHRSGTEKKLRQSAKIRTMRKLQAVNTDQEETKTPRADDNIDVEAPSAMYSYCDFTCHMKKLNENKIKSSREMTELKELNR
ncbi:uncharacterized protein LOC119662745 [Teleopsis dalmanni]|uniref:uncharacterized protein LOC119662745 n=1 Tax=Teleopsis dalmanni TaxID=139649 RepID=UPI0018CEB233|nr:uncharacterized protein LOC119662745 [Teleopsis dalmanni]